MLELNKLYLMDCMEGMAQFPDKYFDLAIVDPPQPYTDSCGYNIDYYHNSTDVNHGSLFSGIGGFDLAAFWIGWTNIFQVEIDKFCQKVLAKNFPNVKRYRDIFKFDGTEYRGRVDVISGGFPCQPFSQAGKRKGTADDRYLWPKMLRVISEVKPAFVVGENVVGLLSMENGRTLERILTDLENEGYRVEVFVIPACGVGAWHRRDRVWIVSNRNNKGLERQLESEEIKRGKWNGEGIRSERGEVGADLNSYIKMFPTPAARDYRSPDKPESDNYKRKQEAGWTIDLPSQIGGQLNPDWVEWLMGYSPGYTNLTESPESQQE